MTAADVRVQALLEGLAEFAAEDLDPPVDGRVGAALVVLAADGDEMRILLTRRQAHLSSHPGQISFPGGRVDPGETIEEAALREAWEEIGLERDSVTVLGRLPAFYIPPSRYWMSTVVARWDQPHQLTPNDAEVAEILAIDIDQLKDPNGWRAVSLSRAGMSWAWDLGETNLLWGATAVVTSVLLGVIDAGWNNGTRPQDLPPEQQVRPWETPATAGLETTAKRPRPRLADVGDVEFLTPPSEASPDEPQAISVAEVESFAADTIQAIDSLVHRPDGPVVALVGTGRTGAVARAVATGLAARGDDVVIVEAHEAVFDESEDADSVPDASDPMSMRRLPSGGPPAGVEGPIGVVVDGMLGRGLTGPLRQPILGLVRSLARTGAPLIALDLPSGIDPNLGMTGDAASADVTIAVEPLLPAHRGLGVAPFLGDIYVSRPGQPLARAILVDRPTAWAE